MLLPSYRRFPLDDEFMREIRVRNLYKFQRCSYYLRRLENYERKERVDVNEYSVEHILPQNEDLSAEWQDALGPNWKEVQSRYLHTLGNLTLTGYNSEYSDKTFQQKRDMKGGFRESPLHLNRGLGDMTAWNAGAIETRATWLSEKCRSVWVAPALSAEQLETYSVKEHVRTKYSLQDHPHLVANPEIKALFEQFRKEVLALDTCVTEEFLKLYVAYKAETNFVDVVPQAKRLRLSVNLDFHEIDDPRGMAVDVTNLGRWGNGDVEVGLSNEDELPYVLGLVRQAFEKQMGEGD
jgi:predicted transport protein